MIVITMIVVLILAFSAVRKLSVTNPGKLQNFMEWVVEFIEGIIGSTLGSKYGRPFMMLGLTLIMYIFVANMLGLPFSFVTEHHETASFLGHEFVTKEMLADAAKHAVAGHEPAVEISWWKSPTADASITFGLTAIVILLTHFMGLTRNTKHYLKHYIEPHWLMFPLNVIKEVSKPLSLSLRLYGNIYAGEVMIAVIMSGLGYFGILPLFVWQGFSVFVGALQSFVFVMLTMVYMSQAILHEEEH